MNWYKEAISEFTKKKMHNLNWELKEQTSLGMYTLYLFRNTYAKLDNNTDLYQIGIEKEGRDMGDIDQQFGRDRMPLTSIPNIKKTFLFIKETVSKWLRQYGPMLFGSNNPKKTRVYEQLLNEMGFKTEQIEIQGHIAYVIKS
ncbi:MAG: hypothetical protein ACOC5T_05285 [Elusimicrobiota bacterium]